MTTPRRQPKEPTVTDPQAMADYFRQRAERRCQRSTREPTVTTPSPADIATAERIVASVNLPLPAIGVPPGTSPLFRLHNAIAAALAEQRETLTNAHYADLKDIEQSADDSCIEADVECCGRLETIRWTCRERMAALTGGPTETNL